MSDTDILQKYTGRKPGTASLLDALGDDELADDLGSFGWLRGVRERAIMLELRKKDGHILAVNYAWLERMEFDPSEGITLRAGDTVIRITGRNLNAEARPLVRLFDGLTRHRVPWVREAGRAENLEVRELVTVIERIDWKEHP